MTWFTLLLLSTGLEKWYSLVLVQFCCYKASSWRRSNVHHLVQSQTSTATSLALAWTRAWRKPSCQMLELVFVYGIVLCTIKFNNTDLFVMTSTDSNFQYSPYSPTNSKTYVSVQIWIFSETLLALPPSLFIQPSSSFLLCGEGGG